MTMFGTVRTRRLFGSAALAALVTLSACGEPPSEGEPSGETEEAVTLPSCGNTLNTTRAVFFTDPTLTPPPIVGFQISTGNSGATCSAILTLTTSINGQIQSQGQFRQTFNGHTTITYKVPFFVNTRSFDLDVQTPFQVRRFSFR